MRSEQNGGHFAVDIFTYIVSNENIQNGSAPSWPLPAPMMANLQNTIWPQWVNSLAPGRLQRNFRKIIFQLILVIDGCSISCKIVLNWMAMDLTDRKSTLVQVMAWCRQATNHYLSQCWPRSLSSLGHNELTHWSLIWHLLNWVIIGSGNGVSSIQYHQAINKIDKVFWSIGTNFSETEIKTQNFLPRRCIWKCCVINNSHFVLDSICLSDTIGSLNHLLGLVQDCSISIANALEILQSCTKPSIF